MRNSKYFAETYLHSVYSIVYTISFNLVVLSRKTVKLVWIIFFIVKYLILLSYSPIIHKICLRFFSRHLSGSGPCFIDSNLFPPIILFLHDFLIDWNIWTTYFSFKNSLKISIVMHILYNKQTILRSKCIYI